jgi:hypothetical protein
MKAIRLSSAAFLAAVAGALVAAFAPLGRTCGTTLPGNEARCWGTSIFSVDGWWVLVVVSVPVVVSLLPLLVRRRPGRIVSAVLLWISCVVGMWSVGVFFVPAVILMTVAATTRDTAPTGAIT